MKRRYYKDGKIEVQELGPGGVVFESDGGDIEVREVDGGFTIRALDGALAIFSETSNQIYVQSKPHDGRRGMT